MLPDSTAVLDNEHLTRVNWEVFFFSTREAKARFDADSVAYCGLVTDPVSKMRFRPTPDSPREMWKGQVYFFTNEDDLADFEADPEALAWPSYPMRKMGSGH